MEKKRTGGTIVTKKLARLGPTNTTMSGEDRGGSGAAVADGPPQPTAPSSPNKRPALPSVVGKIGVKPWSRGGKHNKIGSGSTAKEVGGDGGSSREGSNDDDNVRVGGPQENDENKENGNNGGGKSKNFNALLSKFGGSVKRGGKLAPPAPEQESMPKLVEQQERQHQQEEEVDEEDPPPPPPPLPPGQGEVKKEEEKEKHTEKGIGGKGNFKALSLKFGGGGKNPMSPQQQQQHRQKEEEKEKEKEEEDKEENHNGKGRVGRGNFNALSSKFVGGGKKQKESSKEEESKEDEEDEKRNKKSSGGGKSNNFHALSLKGNFKAPSPKFGLSRKKPQQQWQEGQHQQKEKVDEEDPPPPPPPPPPLPPGEGEVKEEEEEKYTNKGIGGKGNFNALSLKFGGGGKNPLSPLPQQQHRQEEKEKEEADENENHSGKGRVSRSNFNALSSKFGAGGKKQKEPKEEESKEEESKEEEEGEELNKKSSGGGKSNNFLALSSKFGGGGKVGLKKLRQLQPQQQRRDESNLTGALASKFGGDLGKNNRPQQQSPMQREEEKGGAEEGEGFTMLPIGSGGDEQSSGSLFSRAVAAPQSAMLSPGDKPLPSLANRIESSQPDSNHQTTGSLDHGSEGPQSVAEVNDETLKGDSGTLSPPLEGKGSKKLPHIDMSFLKSKFQPPQQSPWWQLQTQRQPEPREMSMPAPPSIAGSAGDNENAGNAKWNLAVEGLDKVTKKLPFAKPPQQGKPPTTQRSRAPPPQVKSRQRSSSTPIKPNKSRYPPQGASHLDNPHPNAAKVKTSPQRGRNNMFKPKSRQRLALEQVAARYFLNQGDDDGARRRYVGITTYGYDGDCNPPVAGVLLGNINEDSSGATPCSGVSPPPLGLNERRPQDNEDRRQLISFLGASDNDDVRNAVKKKSVAEQSQEIQSETDIDAILEIASDHLSLGKNDLALQAYRRAMKCAFANVLSVKQKLVEVTQKRLADAATDGEVEEEELTKQQEKVFELSLLQVASRVADIHNNIGVVHEMNRHYHKARDSYVDALEVYHNTCRRFEEKGDPDVDRTKKNVERMAMACASEEDRRKLHDEAAGLARRLDKERGLSSAQRKSLLGEAVSTLQKALELENSTIGASHPVAAATLVKIGKHRYEMRQYTAAARDIRRAVEILRNALGGCHPQVGKMTLLLASVYERHGGSIVSPATASEPEGGGGNGQGPGTSHSSEDAELELYVDALEPLKATLGEVHPEVGFLYVKIGYLYGKKGDPNLSLLAYKAALNAYSEPPPAAPSSTGGERSMMHPEVLSILSIWVQVTQNLTNLKSWHDVVVAGRRALFLLRRSKNILFPGARLIMAANNSSATSISGAGSASSPNHPPVTPPKSSKISHIQITPDTYYDSLYATLQCLAQAHTSLSDYPQARDACAESLRLAWEMALSEGAKTAASSSEKGEEQAPPLTRSILRIVRALKRLGKAHLLEQRYATALDCFLPSLELLRSSPDMESTLDCASILGSLGFLSLKLKKYTESSNFLRECLRLYEKNGVDTNDRESRKVQAWLKMAESIEDEAVLTPPSFLEIPTIHFHDENSDVR